MWQKDRAQLISAGRQIVDAIKGSATQPQAGTISEDALHQAYRYYDKAFDGKYGGFGSAANKGFNPWLLLSVKLPGEKGRQLESIMPSSAGKDPINGKAAAYVCRDFSCLPPITAPEALYNNLL